MILFLTNSGLFLFLALLLHLLAWPKLIEYISYHQWLISFHPQCQSYAVFWPQKVEQCSMNIEWKYLHSVFRLTWCCWATARVCPRVAGQEFALEWWPVGFGPEGCCRGGWGEAAGPGENGPVLSKLFSLLCTEGDFVPTVGGLKKEEGRLRCFIGIETGLCFAAFSP